MRIVKSSVSLEEIRQMAADMFFDMVKAVVDLDREVLALDAELHSDLEAILLDDGSHQENLWGINLYPDEEGQAFVEFDSLINVRPSRGNRTRGVEDPKTRAKIYAVVNKRVAR